MSRYDIHAICPLCGKTIDIINGQTMKGVQMIRTKRKTTNYYHDSCIEKEYKRCAVGPM